MTDFASCLSVKTYLNMVGLKFQTELRQNAEYMSPSGLYLIHEFDFEYLIFKGLETLKFESLNEQYWSTEFYVKQVI